MNTHEQYGQEYGQESDSSTELAPQQNSSERRSSFQGLPDLSSLRPNKSSPFRHIAERARVGACGVLAGIATCSMFNAQPAFATEAPPQEPTMQQISEQLKPGADGCAVPLDQIGQRIGMDGLTDSDKLALAIQANRDNNSGQTFHNGWTGTEVFNTLSKCKTPQPKLREAFKKQFKEGIQFLDGLEGDTVTEKTPKEQETIRTTKNQYLANMADWMKANISKPEYQTESKNSGFPWLPVAGSAFIASLGFYGLESARQGINNARTRFAGTVPGRFIGNTVNGARLAGNIVRGIGRFVTDPFRRRRP